MSEPVEKLVTSLTDEFLECPVCVEHYDRTERRPRLLKTCLHAFCSKCIDQLLQKDGRGQLTCPMCRHVEKVEGKATSLPPDPVRSKLVDFLHMKRGKKIKCTDCPDGNDADGRCDECQSYLCKECVYVHKRHRLSRDHNISTLGEALKVPIKEFSQGHFCPKHPKHHIEFYCTTHEELCCVSCTVIDHKGHDFEKIQDAATKRTSSLLESLQDVNKTKTGLQQRQKALKAKRKAVEQIIKESERNITKMIDDMKLQLDQRRNQLLSELQQESSAMLSAIEKSSAAYDTTLAVIESTDTYFAQTKEKADDVEMLQMYPAIKRSVDALQSQPVADVRINEDKLKFSPRQKTAFDGLVSQLGALRRQYSTPQAVQHIPASSRGNSKSSCPQGSETSTGNEGSYTLGSPRQPKTRSGVLLPPKYVDVPEVGESFPVRILFVEDPNNFWFTPFHMVQRMDEMMKELNNHLQSLSFRRRRRRRYHCFRSIPLDQSSPNVLVKLTEKNMSRGAMYAGFIRGRWYRIIVKSVLQKHMVSVYCPDYGSYTVLKTSDIQPLPEQFYTLPLCAVKAKLHGIFPIEVNRPWSEAAKNQFFELAADHDLFCFVCDKTLRSG